jgi:hypothetical protein
MLSMVSAWNRSRPVDGTAVAWLARTTWHTVAAFGSNLHRGERGPSLVPHCLLGAAGEPGPLRKRTPRLGGPAAVTPARTARVGDA